MNATFASKHNIPGTGLQELPSALCKSSGSPGGVSHVFPGAQPLGHKKTDHHLLPA